MRKNRTEVRYEDREWEGYGAVGAEGKYYYY